MKLNRIILVIDDDVSSYKGILRFSDTLAAHTHHFTDHSDLMNWASDNRHQFAIHKQMFCVVFDPKYSEIFKVIPTLDFLHHAPKICISRPAQLAKALRIVNTKLFDFMEKPFRLESMKQTLDEAFASHEQENRVQSLFVTLTKRELQTCELIADGLTSKEISEKLTISIKTVKVHRANLMRKIHAKSITELLHTYNSFKSSSKDAIFIPKTYFG
ncbi:MAG: hypothetical protein CTY19_02230 [Methylomonas sp.]|nr:MAG: hypothetical protein CTY19_02230 [Methylomonas sp.]